MFLVSGACGTRLEGRHQQHIPIRFFFFFLLGLSPVFIKRRRLMRDENFCPQQQQQQQQKLSAIFTFHLLFLLLSNQCCGSLYIYRKGAKQVAYGRERESRPPQGRQCGFWKNIHLKERGGAWNMEREEEEKNNQWSCGWEEGKWRIPKNKKRSVQQKSPWRPEGEGPKPAFKVENERNKMFTSLPQKKIHETITRHTQKMAARVFLFPSSFLLSFITRLLQNI